MITIVLVILILFVSIAIYGVIYNLQVLKKRNKILETIKCPVCLVSCPKSGECKTCEKCDTGTKLSIRRIETPVTTVAPSTTPAPSTTVAPSTTLEPKDDDGVPDWAVNAGWPGDEKFLCKLPESCIELSKVYFGNKMETRVRTLTDESVLSKSKCENKASPGEDVKKIKILTKWCPPMHPPTTYAENNFNDKNHPILGYENSPARGLPKSFEYTLSHGILCELSGWTHSARRAKGLMRNEEGKATAIVKGLQPGKYYSYRLHVAVAPSHVTQKLKNLKRKVTGLRDMYVNGKFVSYKQSEEDIPVEGFAIANDSGEIVFEFYVNEKNSETYLNSLSVGGITNEAVEEMKRLKIKEEEEKLETKQGLFEAMLLENHVSNIRN